MGNPFWSAEQVKSIFMEHEGYTERVWAHCKGCGANSRQIVRKHGPMDYTTPHITDMELRDMVEPEGWVFGDDGTARCPACEEALRLAHERRDKVQADPERHTGQDVLNYLQSQKPEEDDDG